VATTDAGWDGSGRIHTGGGAHVRGDVRTGGGDFVGRDKVVRGDEVHGDKIVHEYQL
jgi:hypothetical protein